jgi:hypothetical protein
MIKKQCDRKKMLTAIGMKNYNATHFIQWDFVRQKIVMDKWTGDVRIENPTANQVILVNKYPKGKVYENGTLVKMRLKRTVYLKGKNWWINDSYWLVMRNYKILG